MLFRSLRTTLPMSISLQTQTRLKQVCSFGCFVGTLLTAAIVFNYDGDEFLGYNLLYNSSVTLQEERTVPSWSHIANHWFKLTLAVCHCT